MDEPAEVEEKKVEIIFETGEESCATFILHDEDHTMGNSIRYALMKRKEVEFAGYSIPHPLENAINIRVQTTGTPATKAVEGALNDLQAMGNHILTTFNGAVSEYQGDRS